MRRLVVGVAVVVLFSVAACGGADPVPIEPKSSPKPTPTQTANPGPPVPPAPKAPKLDKQQQADYDEAVKRYREFLDFKSRIAADPTAVSDEAFLDELYTYTAQPGTKAVAASFDRLRAAGIRYEGRTRIEWAVPVRATPTRIIFDQCESPGTSVAIQDGKRFPADSGTTRIRVYVAKISNKWRISNTKSKDGC